MTIHRVSSSCQRKTRIRQSGMCTAEFAVGTLAACGFACVLFALTPDWRTLLTHLFARAFEIRFGWPISQLPW